MMINEKTYFNIVTELLDRIEKTQSLKLLEAGRMISDALDKGEVLHAFSTGHSHMFVEELFYRAGGLVPVNPILDTGLMLHQGAVKSTRLERLPGYARCILEGEDLKEGDPIIIVSNSGINAVPVEAALISKEKRLQVIAVTSVDISGSLKPRHPSGLKLKDVADLTIDNCITGGDASVEIPGTGQYIGAVSSIAITYIAQRLVINIANNFIGKGKTLPIYKSANIPGGDEHNALLINQYKSRIKSLY